MAEYIDKQVYNDAIREAVRKYPNTFYNGLETARQIAHDLPAADVRPVVRGKWIKMTGMMPPECTGHYECSLCGWHERHSVKETEFSFCPNCGADMREES